MAISRSTTASRAWTMCSIQMMLMPSARSCLMVSMRTWTSCSVRPPAISSRSRTLGSVAKARANSRRLRSSRLSDSASTFARGRSPVAVQRPGAELVRGLLRLAPAVGAADEHVLEHGHALERLGDLVGPAQTGVAALVRRLLGDVHAGER